MALSYRASHSSDRQLIKSLDDLAKALTSILDSPQGSQLDTKLAEYVFFPLSHVFRQRQTVPIHALELSLRCLTILLQTGWRQNIVPDLGIQLMILLTFIAANEDGQVRFPDTTEDLLAIDFTCLSFTIQSLAATEQGRAALASIENLPALGHAITTSLDAITSAKSLALGLASLKTVNAFVESLRREVLANFLPGILSTLAKVITPSASRRRPPRVLEKGLHLVSKLLASVLGNEFQYNKNDAQIESGKVSLSPLNSSWLQATAGQTKVALANIVKVRKHDRPEVRTALADLCERLLESCDHNLDDAIPLLLDTLIAISSYDGSSGASSVLRNVVLGKPAYVGYVKQSLYDSFISLPRTLASNDPSTKESVSGQINTAIRLLTEAGADLQGGEEMILSSIRDGLLVTMQDKNAITQSIPPGTNLALHSAGSRATTHDQFPDFLTVDKAHYDNARLISDVVENISSSEQTLGVVRECLDRLCQSTRDASVPDLWIALHILRNRASSTHDIDELLVLDLASPQEQRLREELYETSLSLLSRPEEDSSSSSSDWRMQALALEAVAFHASVLKSAFRQELSDALYPILHFLGSPTPQLRAHAVVALDLMSYSLGYSSTQELIVDNHDYIINGISLKLNSFDISPQAPQVLNMLVRLCGARILPYLDDLTDNIFEALECFHGYDGLVSLLFQCLGTIVEEGVQAPPLMIEGQSALHHPLKVPKPKSVTEVADLLRARKAQEQSAKGKPGADAGDNLGLPVDTPHRPWKDITKSEAHSSEEDTPSQGATDEEKSPPLSKSYQLVHRITVLTQHHLPSGNPLVRSHLSHVLNTAVPYLANHEDTFLPLIHTLWPVLVPRLHDSEVSVVSGVLGVIAKMAEGAGSFVRSRVADIWPDIRRIHERTVANLMSGGSAGNGRGDLRISSPGVSSPKQRIEVGELESISSSVKSQSSRHNILRATPRDESTLDLRPVATKKAVSTRVKAQSPPYESHREYDAYSSNRYILTTTITLRHALTSFLLSLIRHVQVPTWLFNEIVSEMLLPYLILSPQKAPWIEEDVREEVKGVLEICNADAVWLVMLRHGRLPSCAERMTRTKPDDIENAPCFVSYIDAW